MSNHIFFIPGLRKILNLSEKLGNFYANSAYSISKEREKELKTLLRVTVSFKQTTRDIRLYTIVNAKEEKSDFIKDAIEYYAEYLEKKKEGGSDNAGYSYKDM